MRTLVQPIAWWLKEGQKPRTFVRITDATTGAEILPVSSQALGTFEDRLAGEGSQITRAIKHEGGLAEVGSLSIGVNILDTDLALCTAVSIEAKHEGPIRGAGRIFSTGLPGTSYTDVRDAVTGELSTAALVVGRMYNSGSDFHTVARSPMQFTVPAGVTTCEDLYIQLTGLGNGIYNDSGSAFKLRLVEGNWSALSEEGGMFAAFVGHAASGDYTLVDLGEEWETGEYSSTSYIRLNAAGRAKFVAATGGTLKLMLISERDADFTTYSAGASGNEYAIFDAPKVRLVARYNSYRLENQIASVYFAVDPLPSSYTGMDLMWTGVVDSYTITAGVLSLSLKQNDHKKNPMIPAGIITLTDWPNCPEENVGKAVPVVYGSFALTGEHRPGVGNYQCYTPGGTGVGAGNISYPDAIRGLVVKDVDGLKTVLFTGLRLKGYSTANFLFTWNSGIKAFDAFAVHALPVYSSSIGHYTDIHAPALNDQLIEVFAEGKYRSVSTIIPTGNDSFGVTDPEKSYDTDSDTYAIMDTNAGYIDFYFSQPSGVSGETVVAYVVYAEYKNGMEANKLKFQIYRDERDEVTDALNWVLVNNLAPWSADGQEQFSFFDVDDNISFKRRPIQLGQYKLRLYKDTATGEAHIYDVCSLVAHDSNEIIDVYTNCDGNQDDGSGTVTGTPSALIELPPHVIESIGRDQMSLATAEINTASFDTAATALAGMKFAFQLSERKEAREIIDDLSFQGRLKTWWDEQDRLKTKVFSSAAHFPVNNQDYPAALDTFTSTGLATGGSYTTHQIVGEITLRRRTAEMKNKFVVHYKQNYATGEYASVLTCDRTSTTVQDGNLSGTTGAALVALCLASYTETGTEKTLEVYAWAIRDEATATRTIQHLVERLAPAPYEAEFPAGPSANVFEEGDFINIRDELISNRIGAARMNREKWEIIRHEPDVKTHDVGITAVQVV